MAKRKTDENFSIADLLNAALSKPEVQESKEETPVTIEPKKLPKQSSYARFMNELFQGVPHGLMKQLNNMTEVFSEEEVKAALVFYYQYRDDTPDINTWCGYGWFDEKKMGETIRRHKDFRDTLARNTELQKANAEKEAQTTTFSRKEHFYGTDFDETIEGIL